MLELDQASLLVTADTDQKVSELERKLNREGFTLNYFTPPQNEVLLAEAITQRLPNLFHRGFGGIEDLVFQIRLSREDGKVWTHVPTPRSATGPSFKKVAIGYGEGMGVPLQTTLRVFRKASGKFLGVAFFPTQKVQQAFVASLRQWPFGVALAHPVDQIFLKEWLAIEGESNNPLLLAHWGEKQALGVFWSTLSEAVRARDGTWSELPFERLWKKILPRLRLPPMQETLSQEQSDLEKKVRSLT